MTHPNGAIAPIPSPDFAHLRAAAGHDHEPLGPRDRPATAEERTACLVLQDLYSAIGAVCRVTWNVGEGPVHTAICEVAADLDVIATDIWDRYLAALVRKI